MTNDLKCNCSHGVPSEEELLQRLDGELDRYIGSPGSVIPALQFCQNMIGYIPRDAISLISRRFNEPLHKVYGIITFYSYFSTNPRGKNLIRVCMGTACYVLGSSQVLDALRKHLKIDVGATTEDRLFSLEVGRCFGACGLAPVIMINDDVHQQVKPAKIAEILDQYRAKETEAVA